MTQDETPSRPEGEAPEADTSESKAEELERKIHDQPTVAPGKWVKRAVLALVLIALLYVGWRLSAAFFPRWWAQRVADQVQGRMTAGTLWGLFYGFTFTFVPVLVLLQIRRRFFSWAWRGVVALVAVALAAPNWLTLAVVAGDSKAAHAGERIFDVDAPGFRAGTVIGVIVGAVLAFVIVGTSMRMAHQRREVKKLRGERDELKAREPRPDDPDA